MEQEHNLETGNNGWIKIHRKLLENPIASNPNYLALWIHLLLLANHDEGKQFIWNGEVITQKAGQFITGRKKLSQQSGISQTTIERILTFLEKSKIIGQQKNNKYRLITILKWNLYQKVDNKRTTDGQQTDTIKNYNNNKKDTSNKLQGVNEAIKLFEAVNPTYESLFKNTTERKAIEYLITKFGREKIEATIKQLPEIINKPYAPKITRPSELKRDLGKLIAFFNQEKGKLSAKNQPNYVL